MALELHVRLLSDATPGQGDGVAGVLDVEVVYDPMTGAPQLRGRALKGLLVEECANILWSLDAMQSPAYARVEAAAARLFGRPGSTVGDAGALSIAQATLPRELLALLRSLNHDGVVTPHEVLDTLSVVRRQTAVDPVTGAPQQETLRGARALLRGLEFVAPLRGVAADGSVDVALLAACAAATRRLGTARTRGRGRACLWLAAPGRPTLMAYLLAAFADLIAEGEQSA